MLESNQSALAVAYCRGLQGAALDNRLAHLL